MNEENDQMNETTANETAQNTADNYRYICTMDDSTFEGKRAIVNARNSALSLSARGAEAVAMQADYGLSACTADSDARHANTGWDAARFETSMQRWVDLSEADFGVALLNDCKYGYDARGNRLRLTLLKSPVDPWPDADQGEHRCRYAVMPHGGFA